MWRRQCNEGVTWYNLFANMMKERLENDFSRKPCMILPSLPNSKDNQDPELGNLFLCSCSRTCAESIAADDRKMLGAKFCLYSRASRDCKLYIMK
jgi:hypothetical protein